LLTNGGFDDGFGRVFPAHETADIANVHGDGNATKDVPFVRLLPKGKLAVAASYPASFAKRTKFALVSVRHAEKL
jgi:hypothetical protein